ncbi:MAG: ATP-binding protein [Clostridia bacterium]
MKDFEKLKIKLNSLVIFRSLLSKKTIKALGELLSSDMKEHQTAVKIYSEFVLRLFMHSENFSEYILKYMLEDDNIYMRACCKNTKISESLNECLNYEISVLSELSKLSSKDITDKMAYDDYLPTWTNSDYDLKEIYLKRINDLPKHGFGIYARYHVFVLKDGAISPVKYPDPQKISELSGYDRERNLIINNTKALLSGKQSSNVLLYGDAGTGKSSTVKAICNEFKDEGLRLLEVKKNQLYQIPDIVDKLSFNPLKFILFIDDLSFSSNDNDFAALKAILEGSVGGKASNVLVYATSNRRHLIKENFEDRQGTEIHLSDTLQELMSLSARFGLKVTFSKPDKDLFEQIITSLAKMHDIDMDTETLMIRAEAHALRNGGRSPRVAKQFIEQLKTIL